MLGKEFSKSNPRSQYIVSILKVSNVLYETEIVQDENGKWVENIVEYN